MLRNPRFGLRLLGSGDAGKIAVAHDLNPSRMRA
jgi:hypothetical protein